MNNFLLSFFDERQPRRIRVIENTLRNRRTVSTLFWAKQYGILKWTGATRSLERQQVENSIEELVKANLIQRDPAGQVLLTTLGVLRQEELASGQYQPHFFDWYWLANTRRIEQRLLLGIQVASEASYHNRYYAPVVNEYHEQQIVKQWLLSWHGNIIGDLVRELELFGDSLESADERLANYFFYSLIGHQITGKNDMQFSRQLELPGYQLPTIKQDALLAIAAFANSYHGVLNRLLADLLANSPLSQSANQTLLLYQQGMSISQIAQKRGIKANTVREHLLEAAIVYPESIDWDRALPVSIRTQLAERYQGKIVDWQFDPEIVPGGPAAFYYFRLYQLYEERVND
ncbi:helix-turn-helix domain-containing protein [Limosilactobacillus portuensis]|uniref:helix-turn-helix domain-containing protein n=1 Tax=Limosilactobacillus portuensis TaxID=2742601 RepID=UPI003D718B47